MSRALKILLLAGSAEARQIAEMAQADGHRVKALVSEPPRGANPMPVPYDMAVFDDADAIAARMAGFDAVIDASHGFDGAMTEVGQAAALRAHLPLVRYVRPLWSLSESPQWVSAPNVTGAVQKVDRDALVFSAAGWGSLKDCADFPGKRLYLRQTSRHARPAPFPFVELIFGTAPFSVEAEVSTFRDLRIDTLICRNLGGEASRPKLDAAKLLDLKVILIDPPAGPGGTETVADVARIRDWIGRL